MSQRVGSPSAPAQGRHGLSWAAFFNRWLIIALIVLIIGSAAFFDIFEKIGDIPIYWIIGVIGSMFWWPYFIRVHSAKQTQLVVYGSPNRLTIYRVGRRSKGFKIEGNPINFNSVSGYRRVFVTDYDPETNTAKGSQIKGHTTLDYLAKIKTFDTLANKFSEHLEEDRLSRELVAVRQAEGVREQAIKWVNIGLSSQDPEPIIKELEALDIMRANEEVDTSLEVGAVLDEL
tara:strand:- start:1706 stop:2398 length:693 start_codon:yes stop_codon:yes gene_type:complete